MSGDGVIAASTYSLANLLKESDERVEQLMVAIDSLGSHFATVLNFSAKFKDELDEKMPDNLSPTHEKIVILNSRLKVCIEKVNSVIERANLL